MKAMTMLGSRLYTQFAVNHYLAVSMPTTKSGAHADLFVRVDQKYVENHEKNFFFNISEV